MLPSRNLPSDVKTELNSIAKKLVANGKGILAADESVGNVGKHFSEIGVENTTENRRLYRQLLVTTAPDIAPYISGVILFEETLYQKTDNDVLFVNVLRDNGIIAGIKVDKGLSPLDGTENETTTLGLDDLDERCSKYKRDGADFAKWRCTLRISDKTPTRKALLENANVLARYADICQQNRIVPIVEPEVLTEGDHNLERSRTVAENVLNHVFAALSDFGVYLPGILLKTQMVLPGNTCPFKFTTEDIAAATTEALSSRVPAAVPGVVFLSGGQSEEDATVNLNSINALQSCHCKPTADHERCKCDNTPAFPWKLTFSFGRALQASVLRAWSGKKESVELAKGELLKRCRANSLATQGDYEPGSIPTFAGNVNLYTANHNY
ncbi:fructose-bisphosphate aldolase C-like [Teleopsis dalmanni]|uniref:fructose-bisphosphate aldolase C-like n=1 Tax=Teleopsis dalmanni TaxID=139649 RepID=UPI0018CF37AB|nr:fructose-bisphosphate aldolase C-like [Teleopsis dalmanni]